MSLPGNKQKAVASWLGVLVRTGVCGKKDQKTGSGKKPEEPEDNHSEGGNHPGSSGEPKVVEPQLTTPEVVDGIPEKASGEKVPYIHEGHGEKLTVPQHVREPLEARLKLA